MEDESGCIVGCLVIVGVTIAVLLAIQYWYITLLLAATALAVYLIVRANAEKKRLKLEAEAAAREERARRQLHREQQQELRRQMVVLGESSIALFESLPRYLQSAEKYLDQAETDFADGTFVPFWDSIENAATTLGRFDESLHLIEDNSSRYTDLIRKYEDAPPQFPLARHSVAKLGVGSATAERMEAIVRTAHRIHDFADIYMQYKTNQILVAGFTNLAQALNQMTWQITASVDALGASVDESMRAIHSRMDDIGERSNQRHDALMEEASEASAREKEALEMLDNIQRGRRPFP